APLAVWFPPVKGRRPARSGVNYPLPGPAGHRKAGEARNPPWAKRPRLISLPRISSTCWNRESSTRTTTWATPAASCAFSFAPAGRKTSKPFSTPRARNTTAGGWPRACACFTPSPPSGWTFPRSPCPPRAAPGEGGGLVDNGRSLGYNHLVPQPGRSSAWLERCVRDAEAASSNLAAPTRQTGQEPTLKWALSLFSVAHRRTPNQAAAYTYPENPTPKGVRRGARACDREAPAPRAPPSPSRLPRTDAENPGAAAPPKGPPHPKA